LSAPPVAVVNKEFVKQFFGQRNPLGHRFGYAGTGKDSAYEIVGVVEDTTYESVYWKDHAMYFVPMTQRPAHEDEPIEKDLSMYAGAIVIQTDRPVPDMEKLAIATLTAINPNLAMMKFQTFRQQIDDQFTNERMVARLMTLFGGLALLLACTGLYGLLSYEVARRTREIGIRMAVGAQRQNVIGMVVMHALGLAFAGAVIGIVASLGVARLLQSMLYGIGASDPLTLAGVAALLLAVVLAACFLPARRATRIDPLVALRYE